MTVLTIAALLYLFAVNAARASHAQQQFTAALAQWVATREGT